jgi:hypothetical protein
MLCVPERESYLSQMPKFLTFNGRFSWIWEYPSAYGSPGERPDFH